MNRLIIYQAMDHCQLGNLYASRTLWEIYIVYDKYHITKGYAKYVELPDTLYNWIQPVVSLCISDK